jgi:uncharacterized protein (DUF2384 family)
MIIDTSAEPQQKQRTRTFRKFEAPIRYTPEQAKRLDEVLRQAWSSLPSKDAAIAFLNTQSESLGGKPMSLALESDAGLESVKELLEVMRLAAPDQPSPQVGV